MFLIRKFEKHRPGSVFFLKSRRAAVFTEAPADWRAFVQQRIRWGTKNAAFPEWSLRAALAAVLLFCCSVAANFFWTLFETSKAVFSEKTSDLYLPLCILIFQLSFKSFFDFLFLNDLCRFFHRKELMKGFWVSFALHIVYIVWAGLGSLFFKKYKWKGRKVE
jgi:poly-beta-1,6-N-acetyl-D-glucosamine synthase